MSSKQKQNKNTSDSNTVSTKYGSPSGSSTNTQPEQFTENSDQLRDEFLGIEDDEPQDDTDNKPKYGHLINDGQIEDIEDHPEEKEVKNNEEPDFNVKGNIHSEVRFYERAKNTDHPDAPETLHEAWKMGVRVGIEHFDREDFYDYQAARYHEIAKIVMVMNSDGIIETTLNIFKESMTLKTDHLVRCQDPECQRLYNRNEDDACCHWCGCSKQEGRNKTEEELLPKRLA